MKRHVSVIGSLPFGGIERMLLDLLPELRLDGFDCRIACIGRQEGAMAPLFRERGVAVDHVRLRSRWGPLSLRRLAHALEAWGADVVHCHGYAGNISGTLAAVRAGVPVVVGHVHTLGELAVPHRARAERSAQIRRAVTLAVSDGVRGDWLASTGADPERIVTVPNGRRLEPFLEARRDPAVRAELAIEPDRPVIGMVGRLVPAKRPGDFLEVARQVLARRGDAHFLLVGDGPEHRSLQAEVERNGLGGNVTLTGHREDVPALLALMDVFILPSEREGMPLSLIEAMAAGLPVIATDVGGNRELLRNGEAGLLVEVGDAARMAGMVLDLLGGEAARADLGERARRAAMELTIEAMARRLAALYERFARREATGRAGRVVSGGEPMR